MHDLIYKYTLIIIMHILYKSNCVKVIPIFKIFYVYFTSVSCQINPTIGEALTMKIYACAKLLGIVGLDINMN